MSRTEIEKNKNIDIITGDPKKAIWKLSIPMMITMLLIMAYNLADSIWVAGIGPDALAAIGFISPLFLIVIGIGGGIGAGANSLIARSIGERNIPQANNAALHSVVLSVIISIIATIIIVPFLKNILALMGGSGAAVNYGIEYGNIVFGLMIVFVFSSVAAAILRSEGDVVRVTYAMGVTAILNIVLDPIFIYVMGWRMAGAAWATIISSAISVFVMVYWMWIKKDTYLNLNFSEFKPNKMILFEIFKVSLPSALEQLIVSILVMSINAMLVMVSNTTSVAVYTASMRIIQMAMIPLMGLSSAVLTISGEAYGSRNGPKLSETFKYSMKVGFLISIVLGIIIFIFSPQIAHLFAYTDASQSFAPKISELLRILCLFMLSVPLGIIASSVFQGVGKGTTSLILTIFRSVLFELIMAYILGIHFGYGLMGIYIGIVSGAFIGSAIAFLWGVIFLKRVRKIFG